jgi:hypothetical protein
MPLVTEQEYQEANILSMNADTPEPLANGLWQIVRFYRGQIYNRNEANAALDVLRAWGPYSFWPYKPD